MNTSEKVTSEKIKAMTIEEARAQLRVFSTLSEVEEVPTPGQSSFMDRWTELARHFENLITEKAQAEGKFPMGFTPVFVYKNGLNENAEIKADVVRTPEGSFYVEGFKAQNLPTLPIRAYGEIWSVGWDIPTRWAVDARGKTWVNDAHGGPMGRCIVEVLLSQANNDPESLKTIYEVLGKKPPMPEWAQVALSMGWTPPKEFNRAEFE